jgi:hypothetical protein
MRTNDGKVLRFWAVWDDHTNLYGDRRPYVVHHYLADDTMEGLEVHEMNSGRDSPPLLSLVACRTLHRSACKALPPNTNHLFYTEL